MEGQRVENMLSVCELSQVGPRPDLVTNYKNSEALFDGVLIRDDLKLSLSIPPRPERRRTLTIKIRYSNTTGKYSGAHR